SLVDDKAGDLLAAFVLANGGSAVLAPGAFATFTFTQTVTTGNVGATFVNTVNVSGSDDEGNPATDSASATVNYTNVAPSSDIAKSVLPTSVSEGGIGSQSVTYTYTVTNTSPASTDPVTVTSLVDDKAGNLLAAFVAANGGSAVLAPGAFATFTFTQTVTTGNVGATFVNTVNVSGHDDEGSTASDTASATVSYTNVLPTIDIAKSVLPTSVSEGGIGSQSVTYTYTVTNTSPATTDPVTVTSLVDDKAGNLLAAFIAANGGSAVLAPGAFATFTFTQTVTTGNVGATFVNTVNVSG